MSEPVLQADSPWRVADTVAWTTSGNDVVVLDLDSLEMCPLMLKDSAGYIWEELALNGPVGSDLLLRRVAEAYGVDVETIRDDVIRLVTALHEQHLIVCASSDPKA